MRKFAPPKQTHIHSLSKEKHTLFVTLILDLSLLCSLSPSLSMPLNLSLSHSNAVADRQVQKHAQTQHSSSSSSSSSTHVLFSVLNPMERFPDINPYPSCKLPTPHTPSDQAPFSHQGGPHPPLHFQLNFVSFPG